MNLKKATCTALGFALIASMGMGPISAASAADLAVPMGTVESNTINKANQQQIIDVFNGINAFRATKGLKPVKFNVTVSEMAEDWSDAMAAGVFFEHNPNYGSDARVAGRYYSAGEIIAARMDTKGQGLVDQWINSPGHNAIMSDPNYEYIGIGITNTGAAPSMTPPYTLYGTVNFFTFQPLKEPAGSYTHPSDFFAGLPENGPVIKSIQAPAPTVDYTTGIIKAPAVSNVSYYGPDGTQIAVSGTKVDRTVNKPYVVTARPWPGYAISGTSSWSYNLYQAPIVVATQGVTFNPDQYTYTIPKVTGITYYRDAMPVPAGNYASFAGDTINITAKPVAGYSLTGTTNWTYTFMEKVTVNDVTPAKPVFNATTGKYTIPEVDGVQYYVNGVASAPGTFDSGWKAISVTAKADPGYTLVGAAAWSYTFVRPVAPSIASKADIIAIDSKGRLLNYGAGKKNATSAAKVIGASGWGAMKNINVVDWNADGYMDIIAQTKTGALYFYNANKYGGFTRVTLGGSGWAGYDIDVAKWKTADKFPSLIAKNTANGYLYNYPNPSGNTLGSRISLGSGWGSMDVSLLDWDKDAKIDIVAKTSAGQLKLYRTNGAGKFVAETRKVIGSSGWNSFNSIVTVNGYNGGSTSGLMTRSSTGVLYYYQSNKNALAARTTVGTGWNGYVIAGH